MPMTVRRSARRVDRPKDIEPGTDTATDRSTVDSAAPGRWSRKNAAVVRALAYIVKCRGKITASRLVAWDDRNGRHLFQWDDALASVAHRLYQARVFLNSFNEERDGIRIQAFINLPENGDDRAYYSLKRIIADEAMQKRAVELVVSRMETQARTLKFWKLTPEQRAPILERLDTAMTPE